MGTTHELTKTDETPPKQPTSYRWKVGATFLVSLPVMWLIGQLAIFFAGFGIWIIPWVLGARLGPIFLPENGSWLLGTEFDGPIIGFAFFAAIQNALIVWLLLRRKPSAALKRTFILLFVAAIIIVAIYVILYLFGVF